MTILDALGDPDVFGRLARFRDLTSWRAWTVALKALFALPMIDDEMALFTQCTGREVPPDQEANEAAFIVGRRGGKSIIAALISVFLGFFRDWRQYLGPGERVHVVVIAQSTRAAARTALAYIRGLLRDVPAFAREVVAERADEIDLRNGVTISVWPCTYRAARGLTIGAAILDEVDFWWQESINAAEEVVAAVRPAMATLPGTKLIAISSPYTPTGWLHAFHRAHWGQHGPYLVWRASSATMNATLDPERIEAAITEDPERGRAEWLGEWRMGASALFELAALEACCRRTVPVLPPSSDVTYFAGVDPSGGGQDEFAWAVAHREGKGVVLDLVAARGRRGRYPLDLEGAVADCAADLRAYGIRECLGDRYAGQFPVEAFARQRIAYRHSERDKSQLYLELLPLVSMRRVDLPDDPELVRQARLLERRTGALGKDRVDHASGAHDDRINAAALGVTAAMAAVSLPAPAVGVVASAAVRAVMGGGARFPAYRGQRYVVGG